MNQVSQTGGSELCTGTSSWQAGEISLSIGTNVITIATQDAAGNTGTAALTVTDVLRLYPINPEPLEPIPINPVVPITPAVTTASPTTG